MSLINQMLYDLDHRRLQTQGSSASGYIVSGLASPRITNDSSNQLDYRSIATNIMLISLVILMAGILWKYFLIATEENNTVSLAMQPQETMIIATNIPELSNPASTNSTSGSAISATTVIIDNQQPFMTEQPLITKRQQLTRIDDFLSINKGIRTTLLPEKLMIPMVDEINHVVEKQTQSSSEIINKNRPVSTVTNKIKESTIKKTFRPITAVQKAEQAYLSGLKKIQQGEFSNGVEKLQLALSVYPKHIKSRELLAAYMIKAGQGNEAKAILAEGIEQSPKHSPFIKLYARILLEQGQTSKALEVLEENQPDILKDSDYYATLAAVYQRLNQHHQAVFVYKKLTQIQPKSGVYWMGMGISLEANGRHDAAIRAFRHAKTSGTLQANLLKFVNNKLSALTNHSTISNKSVA